MDSYVQVWDKRMGKQSVQIEPVGTFSFSFLKKINLYRYSILSEREKRAQTKNFVYAEIRAVTRQFPSLIATAINLNQNPLLVIEQLFSSFALPPLPFSQHSSSLLLFTISS